MRELKSVAEVLGEDLVWPQEIAEAYDVLKYDEEHLTRLKESAPSVATCGWLKLNGFALLPGPPQDMSLLDIEDLKEEFFYANRGRHIGKKLEKKYGRTPAWYRDNKDQRGQEQFSRKDVVSFGWLAFRKKIIRNTMLKTWSEMVPHISPAERPLNAAEAAWGFTIFKHVHDVTLMKKMYTVTSSVALNGNQVCVGWFSQWGIIVIDKMSYLGSGDRGDHVGLITALKL